MERCLYPRRRPGLLFFVCFLWIGVTVTSSRHSGGGMLSFICALAVIVSNVSLLVPGAAWLKLDSQGFTVRHWFKDKTYRWTDIKEFKLITYRYMFIPIRRSVGFTFSESYPKRNVVSRIAGAIASFDFNLPNNYGMKAQDLLVLLESCRRQTLGADSNRYQVPWPAIEPK